MAAEGHAPTTTEYILHHLTNWTYGKLPAGTYCDGTRVQETTSWVVAHCSEEMKAMGFNAIHLDSMACSGGRPKKPTPVCPPVSSTLLR